MIWHVIKKDLKSLWWLGPALIAAAGGYGFSTYYRYEMRGPFGNPLIDTLVNALPYLLVLLSLARAVQVDSPVTRLGDWHTRPLSRWNILGAKGVIALFGFVLPWGLIDIGWGLAWGMPAIDALAASSLHILALALFALLILSVAASFRILIQFLMVLAGLAIATLIFALNWSRLAELFDPSWPVSPAIDVPLAFNLAWTLAAIAGLIACLLLLYRRRELAKARLTLVGATLGLMVVSTVAAEVYGRAWSPTDRPAPIEGLALAFDPAQPKAPGFISPRSGRRTGEMLSIPIRLDGLGERRILASTVRVTQTAPDGTVLHWGSSVSESRMRIPGRVYPSLQPARLEVLYKLDIGGRPQSLADLPVDGAIHSVPGLGRCRARVASQGEGEAMDIRCLSGPKTGCVDLFTSGRRIGGSCRQAWSPLTPYRETSMHPPRFEGPIQVKTIPELGQVEGRFDTGPVKLEAFVTGGDFRTYLQTMRQREAARTAAAKAPPSPPVNAN